MGRNACGRRDTDVGGRHGLCRRSCHSKGHQGSGRTPCLRLYARTRQLLRVGHPVVQTSPRMDDRARLDPLHDGCGACRIGHHQGLDTSRRESARPDSGLQLLLLQHTQSGMRDPGDPPSTRGRPFQDGLRRLRAQVCRRKDHCLPALQPTESDGQSVDARGTGTDERDLPTPPRRGSE